VLLASKKTLLFRCDATPETGLGHFARCRDLARYLVERTPDLGIEFVGALSPYARGELRALGFRAIDVPADEAIVSEKLFARSEAIILDSYRLTAADYFSPTLTGRRVGVFDDFGAAEKAPIALVLNARASAPERFSYSANATGLGTAFLGPSLEFFALRKQQAAREVAQEIQRIAVFIGATDHYGVGEKIVRAALAVFSRATIDWVGGEPVNERVRAVPFGPNIAPALENTDLAIAGGGRLKYEAGYVLVPLASVSQTPLQEEDTRELCERNLCIDLGAASELSVKALETRLEPLTGRQLRAQLRQAQSAAFPADAPERLVRLVQSALGLEHSPPRLRDRGSR
jgi:spore coat polysaccharide biosynthesis predicted glycosyltransferase SpsG